MSETTSRPTLRKCPAAGATVTLKATRAPGSHPHPSSKRSVDVGASVGIGVGAGVGVAVGIRVGASIGFGVSVGVIACADVSADVAALLVHAPSLYVPTPDARALHALPYVLPSAPHTGAKSARHTWTDEERRNPAAASSKPEAPSRDATRRSRMSSLAGATLLALGPLLTWGRAALALATELN